MDRREFLKRAAVTAPAAALAARFLPEAQAASKLPADPWQVIPADDEFKAAFQKALDRVDFQRLLEDMYYSYVYGVNPIIPDRSTPAGEWFHRRREIMQILEAAAKAAQYLLARPDFVQQWQDSKSLLLMFRPHPDEYAGKDEVSLTNFPLHTPREVERMVWPVTESAYRNVLARKPFAFTQVEYEVTLRPGNDLADRIDLMARVKYYAKDIMHKESERWRIALDGTSSLGSSKPAPDSALFVWGVGSPPLGPPTIHQHLPPLDLSALACPLP